jgi:signal recognition particle subunit SRP14
MAPLMRKRDKKKEKAKAEAAAKRRKELYVDVKLGTEGKRGKGRRQRVSGLMLHDLLNVIGGEW